MMHSDTDDMLHYRSTPAAFPQSMQKEKTKGTLMQDDGSRLAMTTEEGPHEHGKMTKNEIILFHLAAENCTPEKKNADKMHTGKYLKEYTVP